MREESNKQLLSPSTPATNGENGEYKRDILSGLLFELERVIDGYQESPHEHQQALLLSRIINNIVCPSTSTTAWQMSPGELYADEHAGETERIGHGHEQESAGMGCSVVAFGAGY